ncbi:PPE family protein, SVP subgroup [Mycobacterium branderi]|uniref:PE family protein n=1 Tax=Mycobacterium branderi TaxID=43348 RepID=A0A7I7WAT4_9MYCO|nr:PE domain-containing protein [Mycobacterium branderi]MCV7232571.1 PE domain-containing protein [Mycobacterium branderi]ORA40734.1 PE family protein [Mycobacterium branderi]BBZ14604.1 PE family protein [Mycobacterium branderi]
MAFVKTVPEAIAAAAAQLEGIGNSFSAESAAAAPPTTAILPPASDEVSLLQAGVFSTYGQLYQSVSAQAQAVHQQFVNLLGTSAGSYGETEAANQVAAASTPLQGLGSLFGASSAAPTQSTGLGDIFENLANMLGSSSNPFNSNIANLANIQVGNWASAASDLIGMGGGGLLTALPEEAAADIGGVAAGLDGAVTPVATGGVGGLAGAPAVLAGVGQASAVGGLSVPPSWAAGVPGASTPVTFAAQNWTTAAPHAGTVTTMPAGMPSVASAGRGGYGFGAPRYGVKPKVMPAMPKPTVT